MVQGFHIKSHGWYLVRALVRVGVRGKIENQLRGLLRTSGPLFGKKVGGFCCRAEEIASGELTAAPEIRAVVEAIIEPADPSSSG
ncbi:hypothetical protein [Mesorhizobium carmichaelinearum]|uniref:hypothetical protein n=1 Tax=Mesorhizobium carmichaelinearum TaxID=1208188 RepID=UPI000BA3446D|nr:hypothetical protein [Mesorhizobium carmichaelinearum]